MHVLPVVIGPETDGQCGAKRCGAERSEKVSFAGSRPLSGIFPFFPFFFPFFFRFNATCSLYSADLVRSLPALPPVDKCFWCQERLWRHTRARQQQPPPQSLDPSLGWISPHSPPLPPSAPFNTPLSVVRRGCPRRPSSREGA